MAKNIQLFSVFLSSTSEMRKERDISQEVVSQINRQRGSKDDYIIQLLMWEHDVTPDMRIRPQTHINNEIGSDYDIFVGILCSKFGTSTGQYGSGTEEEFSLALQRREKNGFLPKIMFYFRDPRTSEEKIDADELLKIEDFKKRLRGKGVY